MRLRFALVATFLALLATGTTLHAEELSALIVDGQNNHPWKETTPLLKPLLEQTGLFTVDVATSPPKGQDVSGFKPDFAAYSATALGASSLAPMPTMASQVPASRAARTKTAGVPAARKRPPSSPPTNIPRN